jgi:hypothetical protein
VANFFQDPPLPWVCSFGFSWRHTARCWSPCCFFSVPKVSTVAFSLQTSGCFDSDYLYWSWLLTLQTVLCLFFAGCHLISPGLHVSYPGILEAREAVFLSFPSWLSGVSSFSPLL